MQEFRSLLIMPGNNPGMLIKSRAYKADAVIFDIEDAVAPMEKDAARALIKQTLKEIDFGTKPIMVRINPMSVCGKEDLEAVIPEKPVAIVAPKIESAQDVLDIVAEIEKYEPKDVKEPIGILAIIESAKGMRNVYEIAESHERMAGLIFGAEDYTASIGAIRTKSGEEIYTGRSTVVVAARTAGIQSHDTPFVAVDDFEGLAQDTELSKQLGFTGKNAINPRQVDTINKVFSPTPEQLKWAQRIEDAFQEGLEKNLGVINVDGKMVDIPIVIQARKMLEQAKLYDLN